MQAKNPDSENKTEYILKYKPKRKGRLSQYTTENVSVACLVVMETNISVSCLLQKKKIEEVWDKQGLYLHTHRRMCLEPKL